MDKVFLGRVSFQAALAAQEQWHRRIATGESRGVILAFESEPVVTLGVRGDARTDLTIPQAELALLGFSLLQLDRGGQATLHHPGQLVIFPMIQLRREDLRSWICRLVEITRECLRSWQIEARWDEAQPGLYTSQGKIMALGLRLRGGITTHGLAINVSNALSDYALIRACGVSGAAVARMGEGIALEEVYARWVATFEQGGVDGDNFCLAQS